MTYPWRGIFPIVVTPFTPGYELDNILSKIEPLYNVK